MKQVNNINNIKMFYGINEHDNKVEIYDSNKKYFNDMYFDANDEEDIPAIIEMLKQTTLNDMCDFFNAKVYNSIKELSCNEELCEEMGETFMFNEETMTCYDDYGNEFEFRKI